MNYWWVNHAADAIDDERHCGLLFAPLFDAGGRLPAHWRRLESVASGDVLFSVRAGVLAAILVATTAGRLMPYPACFSSPAKLGGRPDGRGVSVSWQDLARPLRVKEVLADEEIQRLVGPGLPLDKNRNQKQGYVFVIPTTLGERLRAEAAA